MGIVSVYNYSSVKTHHIFAMTDPDDIFQLLYAKTPNANSRATAIVHVESAKFNETYRGSGYIRKPYMQIIGNITGFLIEPEDDRTFPCGTKRISMIDPEPVKIHYVLSADELSVLASKGLFAESGDFDVPVNLVNNDIEIPVDMKYHGIYDSPIAAIEVLNSYNIFTCTNDTQYFGIFETCQTVPEVEDERTNPLHEFYPIYQQDIEDDMNFSAVIDNQESLTEDIDVEKEASDEDVVDKDNINKVQQIINRHLATSEQRRGKTDFDSIKTIVNNANAALKEKIEAEKDDTNISDMFADMDSTDADKKTVSLGYAELKDYVERFDRLRKKDDDSSAEDSKNVNVAIDNQLLNEGVDDIAGFDSTSMTDEQKKQKADEKSGKKARDVVRNVDIAEDLKAMNEGRTDIAGQGASNSDNASGNKVNDSANRMNDFLGNILGGSSKPDNGPNFL